MKNRIFRPLFGWTTFVVLLMALILIPFFLYEAAITQWVMELLDRGRNRFWAATLLSGLLAGDLFLPVPSSLTSTALGALLGFWGGLVASWLGMTIGCVAGYYFGAYAGPPAIRRLAGESEIERVRQGAARLGDWMIVLFRPVPVLAEISVVFAGLSRIPFSRFLRLSALSNLGISAAYAAVGSSAAEAESFLLAFGGAIAIPAIGWILLRILSRKRAQRE